MLTNPTVAKLVSDRLLEVHSLLNETVRVVQESSPENEALLFKRAVGQVLAEMLVSLVNPLYQQHPELKPSNLYVPAKKNPAAQ
jgi:hypothetical protein